MTRPSVSRTGEMGFGRRVWYVGGGMWKVQDDNEERYLGGL